MLPGLGQWLRAAMRCRAPQSAKMKPRLRNLAFAACQLEFASQFPVFFPASRELVFLDRHFLAGTQARLESGLDGSAGRITGFNPYAIADFSPASQATASLVLPSAFVVAPDGTVAADPDVIDAAVVTSQDPFIVTYTLDRKASWSDGTPITAEDFSYLRDQLAVQPGTIDPAGYLLISAIRSRDAGKTVEVEFSKPFPDWRTLFSPLLPSHLMKDFPGGWGGWPKPG